MARNLSAAEQKIVDEHSKKWQALFEFEFEFDPELTCLRGYDYARQQAWKSFFELLSDCINEREKINAQTENEQDKLNALFTELKEAVNAAGGAVQYTNNILTYTLPAHATEKKAAIDSLNATYTTLALQSLNKIATFNPNEIPSYSFKTLPKFDYFENSETRDPLVNKIKELIASEHSGLPNLIQSIRHTGLKSDLPQEIGQLETQISQIEGELTEIAKKFISDYENATKSKKAITLLKEYQDSAGTEDKTNPYFEKLETLSKLETQLTVAKTLEELEKLSSAAPQPTTDSEKIILSYYGLAFNFYEQLKTKNLLKKETITVNPNINDNSRGQMTAEAKAKSNTPTFIQTQEIVTIEYIPFGSEETAKKILTTFDTSILSQIDAQVTLPIFKGIIKAIFPDPRRWNTTLTGKEQGQKGKGALPIFEQWVKTNRHPTQPISATVNGSNFLKGYLTRKISDVVNEYLAKSVKAGSAGKTNAINLRSNVANADSWETAYRLVRDFINKPHASTLRPDSLVVMIIDKLFNDKNLKNEFFNHDGKKDPQDFKERFKKLKACVREEPITKNSLNNATATLVKIFKDAISAYSAASPLKQALLNNLSLITDETIMQAITAGFVNVETANDPFQTHLLCCLYNNATTQIAIFDSINAISKALDAEKADANTSTHPQLLREYLKPRFKQAPVELITTCRDAASTFASRSTSPTDARINTLSTAVASDSLQLEVVLHALVGALAGVDKVPTPFQIHLLCSLYNNTTARTYVFSKPDQIPAKLNAKPADSTNPAHQQTLQEHLLPQFKNAPNFTPSPFLTLASH